MIVGLVNSDHEAILRVTIQGPTGQQLDIDAVVDTGFDGWITLPPSLIAQLSLVWEKLGRATLGDGSDCVYDVYQGVAIWDGQPRPIVVDEADTISLVGMSLLEGFELTIQVRLGGQVMIAPLP